MKLKTWSEQFEEKPERTTLKIILTVVIIVVIVGMVIAAIRLVLYPVGQAQRVVEKTLEAENVIYNYEYFKQAYQDIQATDNKIATAQQALEQFLKDAGSREKWDFRDKEEHQRLQTNVVGLKNVRAEMKATYNARSKMVNRSIFMGRELPQQIE